MIWNLGAKFINPEKPKEYFWLTYLTSACTKNEAIENSAERISNQEPLATNLVEIQFSNIDKDKRPTPVGKTWSL